MAASWNGLQAKHVAAIWLCGLGAAIALVVLQRNDGQMKSLSAVHRSVHGVLQIGCVNRCG